MSLKANSVLDIYAILLLVVLQFYSSSGGSRVSKQHRVYVSMLVVTVSLLILDMVARFDGLSQPFFPAVNWLGNLLLFLITPLLPSLWVVYVYMQTRDSGFPRGALVGLILINAANVLMVSASQFTGWYYTIDSANIYHRGPFYPYHHVVTLIMLVWAFVVILWNRRGLDKRVRYSLFFFPIPSILGGLLQVLIYSYAFALVASVPALLVVLLYAQDDSIYTDYLTGVGNRKKLEAVLKEKVSKSSPNRTFAFIMLDIDHFKVINDTLGHETGDRVLKNAADLLKKCVRANDYVTRYGGDEFCLILDVSTQEGLDRVVGRIRSALATFNQSSAHSVPLSFSMGCQVYDLGESLAPEAFLKRVDMLMYEDKRTKSAPTEALNASI
jgi:diguanylate cyclase (GGDEF)-like protein